MFTDVWFFVAFNILVIRVHPCPPNGNSYTFKLYPAHLNGLLETSEQQGSNGLFRSYRLLSLGLHSLSVSKQAGKLRNQTLEPTWHKYQKPDQDSAKE